MALRPVLGVALGFAAGSLPLTNWAARRRAGVDLRRVGTGTVSGTGLARVAGTRVLVAVGLAELVKGAIGPLVAGRGHPAARALAGAAAVAGHNWSPLLKGAGGRGISPAMGALAVSAPAGAGVLFAGLALGRLGGETALGSAAADVAAIPVSLRYHGRDGRWAAVGVVTPMVVKRLTGNAPPTMASKWQVYLYRLLFDRDTLAKSTINYVPGKYVPGREAPA